MKWTISLNKIEINVSKKYSIGSLPITVLFNLNLSLGKRWSYASLLKPAAGHFIIKFSIVSN